MSEEPSGKRHWIEYVSATVAVVISVVSLWVGIESEESNQKMVAASSWPYLQIDTSNSDLQNHPILTFAVQNSGVGPAKVRSFEIFWKGRPFHNSFGLMHACCGYELPAAVPLTASTSEAPPGLVTSGRISKTVIRAGDSATFLTVPLVPANEAAWKKFDDARQHDIRYRICYCSVFDECWIDEADFSGDVGPKRVDTCPVPKVAYFE